MGYQITFKPTDEAMDKLVKDYKANYDTRSALEEMKVGLLCYCMKPTDDYVDKIYRRIKMELEFIKDKVIQDEYVSIYNQYKNSEDGLIWYCGWEFSHDWDGEIDGTVKYAAEKLMTLTYLTEKYDYFDENEKFYDKYNEASSTIGYFIEEISTYAAHNIIDELKPYEYGQDLPDE